MPPKPVAPEIRIWRKVDKYGPLPKWAPWLGPCWIWTGGKCGTGHGHFRTGGAGSKQTTSHRFMYEMTYGPVPNGLVLDHLCRVPACCNPDHVEATTQQINLLRGFSIQANNARKTHCMRGHAFDDGNTLIVSGGRQCRTCKNNRQRAARALVKAAA